MTLEDYFLHYFKMNISDHSLKAYTYEGKTTFYIYPENRDTDTLDFEIEGNRLFPRFSIGDV